MKAGTEGVLLATAIAAAMTLAAAKVGAVPPAAEAMFREGRRLMAVGDIAQACAQFAGSYALEPASGTLLNLALCHEKEGKIATAWAEFRAAATLAREQDRRDRSAAAEERIAVLEPKLAYVTVVAPPGSPTSRSRTTNPDRARSVWERPFPSTLASITYTRSRPGIARG